MSKQQDSGAMVFVVEDDDAVRESMTLYLEHKGLVVESYSTAESFLGAYCSNQAAGGQAACLVLDVRMPGMSGLELQGRLVSKGFSLPTIFVSGHGDVPLLVRAMGTGAVDFLEKPFSNQVLMERIEEAIAEDARSRCNFVAGV